ncbi:MAG: ATP-binding protein [Crocinitomicaceae bacterium]
MEGKGKLNITLKSTSEMAVIYISDTGKGMTPQQIRSISNMQKRGWGWFLVKRIVEEYHKGKVVVEKSQIGEGTTFKVTIPM